MLADDNKTSRTRAVVDLVVLLGRSRDVKTQRLAVHVAQRVSMSSLFGSLFLSTSTFQPGGR